MYNAEILDAVRYLQEWDVGQPGVAIQLNPDRLHATVNDSPARWCRATEVAPGLDQGQDLGSPGLPNEPCGPPLLTCDVLPDYARCDDGVGREYDVCLSGGCQSLGCGAVACEPAYAPFPIPDLERQLRRIGQNPESGVWDQTTGLAWQRPDEPGPARSWNAAAAHCDETSWGGFDDWRLPSIYELFSIVDPRERRPAINPAELRDSTPAGGVYWSSSGVPGDAGRLAVQFDLGAVAVVDRSDPLLVRCVRGEPPGPLLHGGRYGEELRDGANLLFDHRNGLHWDTRVRDLRVPADGWDANICSPVHGGFDDWRLPTLAELMSIVDYRNPEQRLPQAFFPVLRSVLGARADYQFWTSTASADDAAQGWRIDLLTGETMQERLDLPGFGLCVRSGAD